MAAANKQDGHIGLGPSALIMVHERWLVTEMSHHSEPSWCLPKSFCQSTDKVRPGLGEILWSASVGTLYIPKYLVVYLLT